MTSRIAIASDHGGIELKQIIVEYLDGQGTKPIDLGVNSSDSVDYPDMAHQLAHTVLDKQADMGILICGTGIGMSLAANRHPGIRAALCTDPYMARMSREHNDANVLCLGGRVIGSELAKDIVNAFLGGKFEGGRHARRIAKIETQ